MHVQVWAWGWAKKGHGWKSPSTQVEVVAPPFLGLGPWSNHFSLLSISFLSL